MKTRRNLGRGILISVVIATILCAAGLASRSPAGEAPVKMSPPPRGIFHRVFIVVLENTDYEQALRQPFLEHLASIGALFTDYHSVTHPSYPNYLAMAAGSTLGVAHDSPKDLDATSLVDLLEPAGVTWKVYAENLPSPCFRGTSSPDGLYVRRHEPYISFRNVQENPARCDRIVNAEQLRADVARDTLPQYSLYIPNVRNDGHDTGVAYADTWLKTFLSPLLENPSFKKDTLVVVTFDENGGFWGNRIYTALVGPMVRAGATNGTRYDHYSLLRTIEENYDVGSLGREDARATAICCVWSQ
jgi:hypothetical protein